MTRIAIAALAAVIASPAGIFASPGLQATGRAFSATAWVRIVIRPRSAPWDRTVREQLANALLVYCRDVQQAIPRNTPVEDDWVADELKSSDPQRLTAILSSVEYSRWTLSRSFAACSQHAEGTLRALKSPDRAAEAIQWSEFALSFNYAEEWRAYASKVGLVRGEDDRYAFEMMPGLRRGLIEASVAALSDK
jgi:hypothetical protein